MSTGLFPYVTGIFQERIKISDGPFSAPNTQRAASKLTSDTVKT